jgi:sugar lactone lactonase YvrE
VAVDAAGNIFIGDNGANVIFRVDASSGVISIAAGNGSFGFAGDGGLATNARLGGNGSGVAVDSVGNLFISDSNNHRIRKVDAVTGIITTVAGSGLAGYDGDGIDATMAALFYPQGIAVDSDGSLYIADNQNDRIRKVDSSGIITTVAGSGVYGFDGDGGPATDARLAYPLSVAVDTSGNLYISDSDNSRIRKVTVATGVIATVAGSGAGGYGGDGGPATSATFANQTGVAVDSAGNIYVADYDNNRVRMVDAASGIITTVAGNGARSFSGDGGHATLAALAGPIAVAVDSLGAVLIADQYNNRLRRLGPPVNTPAGTTDPVLITATLPGGSATTIALDFAEVVASGNTAVAVSTEGPPPPSGFKLSGGQPVYFDITTTASYTGTITLCFTWQEGQFANEANVHLFHYQGGSWVEISTTPNTADNVICGETESLSPFALAEKAYDFGGFEKPLLADGSASIQQSNQGRTISVKFTLTHNGSPVTAAVVTIEVFKVLDSATGTTDTTDLTSDAGSSNDNTNRFRYDDAGRYTYNLSTKGWSAPATYRIVVRIDDGTVQTTEFSLR